jgi:cellobiose phosphorylase
MHPFQIHTNGRLRSIVTPDGQGGIYYDWIAITRWSESAPDWSGPMLYVRSENETFAARNELTNNDLHIDIDAGVPTSIDAEIRKISITNIGQVSKSIELTTYAEISLNHPMGDAGHPAFSKLFVQTAVEGEHPILLARRRPRGLNENWPWVAQTLLSDGKNLSWETRRATFFGRGRTHEDPIAMDTPGPLEGGTGNVLDPVMAWRCDLTLGPGETKTLWLVTAVAADKAAVVSTVEANLSASSLEKLLAGSKRARIERYDAIASIMMTGRTDRKVPASMEGSGIVHRFPLSPDEFRVIAPDGWDAPATQDLVEALPYWRSLGLQVRLFVMDSKAPSPLPESVIIVDPASITAEEMPWWLASARWLAGGNIEAPSAPKPHPSPDRSKSAGTDFTEPLNHFNGHGGFSADGREYVILLPLENGRLKLPPMPWVNVLANETFGCIVSERGAGYTWSRNSQANRLTPWSNDPMRDAHGEAIFLRDDETGDVWSPVPGPCPAQSAFVVRHGFGRTRFLSQCSGLSQNVEFLVPPEDAIKLVSVTLKNDGARDRQLSLASYQSVVMASIPDRHHATLAWTDDSGLQHAINPRAGDFAGGRAFSFTVLHGVEERSNRTLNSKSAFLGQGEIEYPSSLGSELTNIRGFGRDACFSSQTSFTLPAGAEVTLVIALGEAQSEAEELRLFEKYQRSGSSLAASLETDTHWEKILNHVHIRTPLPEIDLMVNGWLLYQNLACRIWGRSAFYQSGGAYGFRDQLQDSGAFAALHPELMRSQILLHAAQQFPEGDVTHWWHPEPMGRGMRTKFADDLLWLPYLTDHYLQVTGDDSVLNESRPFIEGPQLGPHEDEEYMKPTISDRSVTVFEHCCLAIDKSLATGAHGLPLMGIGDWNDGMSRIGREGRGESVWMGFFLITILERWIPLCAERSESERVSKYTQSRENLLTAVNAAGWDGEWYRRAYYDDGTPLGTHTDDECRIDVLAQAWAVISKSASEERAKLALDSVERELVDTEHGIVRLLHPPFVNTPHDPGYIKGYVAGVRENGGQYTHAACWVVRAMAEAGRRDEAAELLHRLSPVWHSRDQDAVATYQVEPYVVAADIYGTAPHVGRGGWTWYTGSAGWMFRVAIESVLGLRVEGGDSLVLDPRVPDSWPGYQIDFRTPSGRTLYQIEVTNPSGNAAHVRSLTVDGNSVEFSEGTARWFMVDDGGTHTVKVVLGG